MSNPHPTCAGAPTTDHPRRCQARLKRKGGKQCGRWALLNRKYCQFHGGRLPLARKTNLPRFYIHRLGPTLKRKVEELLCMSHDDQINLYEELALVRVAASEAVKLAEPALSGEDIKPETKQLAFEIMQSALGEVREFVTAAAKIEKDSNGRVSLRVVNLFVLQIIRAIYRACGTDIETAKRIEQEINDTVRIPQDGEIDPTVEGTTLLPSDAVKEMDASIGGEENGESTTD